MLCCRIYETAVKIALSIIFFSSSQISKKRQLRHSAPRTRSPPIPPPLAGFAACRPLWPHDSSLHMMESRSVVVLWLYHDCVYISCWSRIHVIHLITSETQRIVRPKARIHTTNTSLSSPSSTPPEYHPRPILNSHFDNQNLESGIHASSRSASCYVSSFPRVNSAW